MKTNQATPVIRNTGRGHAHLSWGFVLSVVCLTMIINQYMVLTGSSVRVSSTHRVAVETARTLASIEHRVQEALNESESEILAPSQVLKEQSALTEVECEWIRQYWLQGTRHDELHVDRHGLSNTRAHVLAEIGETYPFGRRFGVGRNKCTTTKRNDGSDTTSRIDGMY